MCLTLGICQLFTPNIHGITEDSSPNIIGNYIVADKIDSGEFYDNSYLLTILDIKYGWMNAISMIGTRATYNHPIVLNFRHMVSQKDFIKLDIIESIEMSGGEIIAIIKTLWLRILQRRWKNIFRDRQNRIKLCKTPRALNYRALTGGWPKYCK